MQKTGQWVHSSPAGVNEPEPDSNGSSGTKVVTGTGYVWFRVSFDTQYVL